MDGWVGWVVGKVCGWLSGCKGAWVVGRTVVG